MLQINEVCAHLFALLHHVERSHSSTCRDNVGTAAPLCLRCYTGSTAVVGLSRCLDGSYCLTYGRSFALSLDRRMARSQYGHKCQVDCVLDPNFILSRWNALWSENSRKASRSAVQHKHIFAMPRRNWHDEACRPKTAFTQLSSLERMNAIALGAWTE